MKAQGRPLELATGLSTASLHTGPNIHLPLWGYGGCQG